MWKWFYYAPNTIKEMYERQEMLAKAKVGAAAALAGNRGAPCIP